MCYHVYLTTGDEEQKLGIPISPLCDRRTVKKADSQIGFLKFVVRPTYALLGEVLPTVKDEVIPIIDQNIHYWTGEKSRMSLLVATLKANIKFRSLGSFGAKQGTKGDVSIDGSSNCTGPKGKLGGEKKRLS